MSRQSLTGHTLYVQTKSYWTYKICLDKVLLDIQNMSRLRLAGHTEDVQTKSYWTYRICLKKSNRTGEHGITFISDIKVHLRSS